MGGKVGAEHTPNFGLVQIWWGNGKGKTTAAIGMGFRTAGRGFRVHLIQFMKGGIAGIQEFDEYGELMSMDRLPNFTYERFGMPEWIVGKPKPVHIEAAQKALEHSRKAAASGKYDMLIVDECLYAIQLGVLKEEDIVGLIESKAKDTELVLTGSHIKIPKVEALADLVSEVKKIKHPFDRGIPARIGTEF